MPETDERPHEDAGSARTARQAAPPEGEGDRVKPTDGVSEGDMRHRVPGSSIRIEEESGIAAAEATGKIRTDNDEDPQETAGSG